MKKEIQIIDDLNSELLNQINDIFNNLKKKSDEFDFQKTRSEDIINNSEKIKQFVIINEDNLNNDINELVEFIRNKEKNAALGILSSNPNKVFRDNLLEKETIFYIRKPFTDKEIFYTINNIIDLITYQKGTNALTGLPGNSEIQKEIKERLASGKVFAIMYLDLDNFKSYNDVYGFSAGDEFIKLTGEIIKKGIFCKNDAKDPFVGHIGGDDFIAVVDECNYKDICEMILDEFDKYSVEMFTEEDLENGFLEVANRKGIVEKFPLTTISIGVVEVNNKKFSNTLEIAEVGAQVKAKAKQIQGSSYVIDRRKEKPIKKSEKELSAKEKVLLDELRHSTC